jgi:hypothetical protein
VNEWYLTTERLPQNGERVLAYVPGNMFFLPGKSGEFELREVIVLHFCEDFYPEGSDKCNKYGPHFWQGEGNSNHFFGDVEAWCSMPHPHL